MHATSRAKQKRVVHFASGDLWGGAEAVVFTLVREQHRRDPDGVACVLMNPGQLAERLAALGVRLLVLDESRQGLVALARKAGKFVDSVAAEVLHAHRRKENLLVLLVAARRFASGRRLPRITTVHGMPEPVAQGNAIRRRLTEAVNEFVLARGLDAMVAVSRDIEVRMRARFPRSRVVCVHNGVDAPPLLPPVDSLAGRPLRLLALGRLVPIKRFDRLREISDALATLRERPQVTLAGDGPLRDALAHTLGVSEPSTTTIQMPGFIAQPETLFARADALLITSDHEGIPMVALEALARGIPVFGFSVGGLPEIAASGVPMTLVAPGDSAALARSIHAHFATLQGSARRMPPADWMFSIEHCADDYQELYAGVCTGSAHAGQS